MRLSRRHLRWVGIALLVALFLVGITTSAIVGAVNSTLIREQQKTNTSTLNSAEETAKLVEDCTSPGGKCYERGQRSTSSAVGDIGRVTVLAAACSAELQGADMTVPQRADRIQACIVKQLDGDHRR